MASLDGKAAVVTGASRGLGRHIAQALIGAGARVALLARASSALAETAGRLGAMATPIATDVADPASVEAAFTAVLEQLGRLDILINNAAIFQPFKLEGASTQQIERHFSTNLLGAVWCARAAVPHLRAAGGGDIINISSRAVRIPPPMLSIYASTKGGLESFSAGLREEVRASGTRVTVLRIGRVAGGEGGRHVPPEVAAQFQEEMRRSGVPARAGGPVAPEGVARAIIDLLSLPRDMNIDMIETYPI